MDEASSITENTQIAQINSLSVFPNPVSTSLSINSSFENLGVVKIYDMTGRMKFSTVIDQSFQLNVTDWAAGIYFVKLTDEQGVTIGERKIVVQ